MKEVDMYKNEEDNKKLVKFTASKIEPSVIFEEAKREAHKVVDEFVAKHGDPLYCGFANVAIRPAKGPFVKWLKEKGIGSLNYGGGYRIGWHEISKGHKNSYTQSMDIKEEGCDAFVDVLEKYGMNAYMQSRPD